MTDRLDHQLRTLVAITALEPCCLCSGESDVVGVFTPKRERAHEYGAPNGKHRMLFYAICSRCLHSDNATPRIEEAILRGLRDFRVVKGTRS